MPQTYQKLDDGQFIMTFADLEGDLSFLERSLDLYKDEYKRLFPSVVLAEDDFSITGEKPMTQYIKFPEQVICVNIGDLTDKTRSNTGQKACYNLSLVTIMSNTHNHYGNRMVSILGNRETTKLRLHNELNNDYIEKVLAQELSLTPEARKLTGERRPIALVWVDGPAKSFLTYLKIAVALSQGVVANEEELKDQNKLNLDDARLTSISDVEVRRFFEDKTAEDQQILYAKWMLANSCGAPDLWQDVATEANTSGNERETLAVFKQFFSSSQGPYVNYLKQCQIGAQIGTTLFTHGGLEDNSFTMPESLFKVLSKQQIQDLFGVDEADTLPHLRRRLIAHSVIQMLRALNTWYAVLIAYRFSNEPQKNADMEEGLAELLNMALPRGRHEGASLINIAFTDKEGAYGNPITAKTHKKLIHNHDVEPIYIAYHGHMPAEQPRVGTVVNQIDAQEVLLHRLDGDTCNYRKNKAAVACSVYAENNHTVVEVARIAQYEGAQVTRHLVTSRSATGDLELPDGTSLKGSVISYFGRQVKFNEFDKGWNITDYNQQEDTFVLFKQNGPPSFTPETKLVPAVDLYRAVRIHEHAKKQSSLEQDLDARFAAIEEKAQQANGPLKDFLKDTLITKLAQLKDQEKIALALVDIQNDFVLSGFALYVVGGEQTVVSTIALLEVISELIEQNASVAHKIDLITSQDAHILGRATNSPDSELMKRAYGDEETVRIINAEQQELAPFNPKANQFDLHCMLGCPGAAIAKPIATRLDALKANHVTIYRFGKINFSAPEAGMILKDGIDITNPQYQNEANGIYDSKALSYRDFFAQAQYEDVLVMGICGNVCVQQTAEGLVNQVNCVSVIDPLSHYLVSPGLTSLDTVRAVTVASYTAKGIGYLESKECRANPELTSDVVFASKSNAHNAAAIEKLLTAMADRLQEFDKKIDQLTEYKNKGHKGYAEAEIAALTLRNELHRAVRLNEDIDVFKHTVDQSIQKARDVLSTHRGWSELLHALASALVSACSLGIANAMTNTGFFGFFKVKTDSERMLDQLESTLNAGAVN